MQFPRQYLNRLQFTRNAISYVVPVRNGIGYRYSSNLLICPNSRTGFDIYHETKERFQLPKQSQYNFVKDCVRYWSLKTPNRCALWWIDDQKAEKKLSFSQIDELSARLANGLTAACGLKRKDNVIVILPRIPEWWLINVACIRTGTVSCPGTTLLTEKDIVSRLRASEAKAIVTSSDMIPLIEKISCNFPELKKICVSENLRPDGWFSIDELIAKGSPEHECVNTSAEETMMLFFTSGTTGAPKMADISHESYGLGHIVTGRYWLDLTEKDVMWTNADTGWAKSAYTYIFASWLMGSTVFTHQTKGFDPERTLRILEEYPITTFCTVPTAYRSLVQERLVDVKFKSLSHCVSAGEPLNAEVYESWRKGTDLGIFEGYGQTETVLICGNFKCIETKPGSMGKPSPGFDIDIIDEDLKPLPDMIEGDIAVRTKPQKPVGIFNGYLGDDERNRRVFAGDYYITGDRGYKDKDGYVWFVGRADDVIISAGYRIGPFEVESALIEHPAVMESAVVSSPDDLRGEVVKAFVVLTREARDTDPHILVKDLQNHVKRTTAPYKYPRKIEFVEQLPKTVSGKIRRVELRAREWGRL